MSFRSHVAPSVHELGLVVLFCCCSNTPIVMTWSLAGLLVLSAFPVPLSSFVAAPALLAHGKAGQDQPTSSWMHLPGEFERMSAAHVFVCAIWVSGLEAVHCILWATISDSASWRDLAVLDSLECRPSRCVSGTQRHPVSANSNSMWTMPCHAYCCCSM